MCHRRLGTLFVGFAGSWATVLVGSSAAQTGAAEAGEILRRLQTQSGVEINLGAGGDVEVKVPGAADADANTDADAASPFSRGSSAAASGPAKTATAGPARVERDARGIRVNLPPAAARALAAAGERSSATRETPPHAAGDRPVRLPAGIDQWIGSLVPELGLGTDGVSVRRNDLRVDAGDGFALELDTPAGRVVVNQQGLEAYAAAAQAFRARDYESALRHADAAAGAMPQMAKFMQFRGLARFAVGDFESAAEDVYQALRTGPAWDWPAVADFYADPADYATRYRDLQRAAGAAPGSAELQFLVAYHHMVLGHHDAARAAWQRTRRLLPEDPVVSDQLGRLEARPAPLPTVD